MGDKTQNTGDEWHDEWRVLRLMNETRLTFIRDELLRHWRLTSSQSHELLRERRALDVGCGIGIASEALARWQGVVDAIDEDGDRIKTARRLAAKKQLNIAYHHQSLGDYRARQNKPYDLIIALEVVEHVSDVAAFLKQLHDLLHDDGMVIISTLNRTLLSYVFGIVGAEYITNAVPRGTHDWHAFITPSELENLLREANLARVAQSGMMFHPLRRCFELHARRLGINYIVAAVKARR